MKHKISFYIKYYATRLKVNFLYTFLALINYKKIKKGDNVKCYGIGYSHWKDREFECTAVFNDGRIGINNTIKVSKKDFKKV